MAVDLSHLCDAFNEMLSDMGEYYLEVHLVDSKYKEQAIRGAKIRMVFNENVDWYKKLCNKYQSSRIRRSLKSDTRIKRKNIKELLERLVDNKHTSSYYLDDLILIAENININIDKYYEDPPF